jgi:Ca2+-binding RTX toxin-like protein
VGGGEADVINVSASSGTLNYTGGAGIDTITGGAGAVTITDAGNGDNVFNAGAGDFTITLAGTGADDINGGAGTLIVTASGDGIDNIAAGTGNVTVTDAGAGADVIAGGTGTLTVTDAGAGADVITVSTGVFDVTGGADNDVLVISNGDLTSADTFAGGAGTGDEIQIDNATTLVDADFTNVTTAETLDSAVADVALNVTLGTEANEAGLIDIDGGTAADIINGAGMTLAITVTDEGGDNVITGGAGDDSITGGGDADTITGGAGADTLIGGDGADIYVFSSTAALNGDDTITFVQADDKLDFSNFLSGGSTEANTAPVAATGTADIQLNNKLIILDDAAADLTDAAIAAAVEGIGDAMQLTSGGKGIVVLADAADAASVMSIFFVDDNLDGTAGTVSADDVVLVGQSATGIDADALANGNFIF